MAPAKKLEGEPQQAILMRLRFHIDTAGSYPTQENIDRAVAYAVAHPHALRSERVRHLLGKGRWEWLSEHGVYPAGEPLTVAGIDAIKETITPEVTK